MLWSKRGLAGMCGIHRLFDLPLPSYGKASATTLFSSCSSLPSVAAHPIGYWCDHAARQGRQARRVPPHHCGKSPWGLCAYERISALRVGWYLNTLDIGLQRFLTAAFHAVCVRYEGPPLPRAFLSRLAWYSLTPRLKLLSHVPRPRFFARTSKPHAVFVRSPIRCEIQLVGELLLVPFY